MFFFGGSGGQIFPRIIGSSGSGGFTGSGGQTSPSSLIGCSGSLGSFATGFSGGSAIIPTGGISSMFLPSLCLLLSSSFGGCCGV